MIAAIALFNGTSGTATRRGVTAADTDSVKRTRSAVGENAAVYGDRGVEFLNAYAAARPGCTFLKPFGILAVVSPMVPTVCPLAA